MVNDSEKLVCFVQWDDFWNCLKIAYCNIYDGGNSLTMLLPPEYQMLCNHGVIVDTFDEFVNVNKQLMACNLDDKTELIAALKDKIELSRKKMTEIRRMFSKDFKSLNKARKAK